MNFKYYFYITLVLSIIIQILVTLVEITAAFFTDIDPKYAIIRELVIIETTVEFIEFGFYLWFAYYFNEISNVTPKRYIDWTATTPSMLITLVVYLTYLNYKEKGLDTSKLKFFNVLLENSSNLLYILCLNWLMLIFGFLGEQKIINIVTSTILGFIPFLIYYYIIYVNYARQSKSGLQIFWYFFSFWSLYGIAALFPYYIKNTFYNILDLFAKNFFGLFLSYIIITKNY
jgi:hypothetical protein